MSCLNAVKAIAAGLGHHDGALIVPVVLSNKEVVGMVKWSTMPDSTTSSKEGNGPGLFENQFKTWRDQRATEDKEKSICKVQKNVECYYLLFLVMCRRRGVQ